MKGILLVNLGSPDSPSVPDVRRYLREFLMDGRVLDAPWPIRFCIVHLAILPSRPKQSSHAYQLIWTPAGSPLIVTSQNVRAALQKRLLVPVELAMRYQNPSIAHALGKLRDQGVTECLVIPMFPHYAMSSYETAVARVQELASGLKLHVQPPYFDDPAYIRALAGSAEEHLKQSYDHLLFSFHGIPERHLRKSDPTGRHCLSRPDCCDCDSPAIATCYRAQCFKTAAAFVKQTGVTNYSVSFQSRLGRDPWLTPYTDQELPRLAAAGVKRIVVICPAFVSDCLETIEEIGMRGKETFLAAGGQEFRQIPCLNEHPLWIEALEKMAKDFLGR
jgi:ferrochelatase